MEMNFSTLSIRIFIFLIISLCKDSLGSPITTTDDVQELEERLSTTTPFPTNDVCTSQECEEAESTMLKYMDKNVEPCENFYDFACGNFPKITEIPEGQLVVDAFNSLQFEVVQQLKNALAEPILSNESKPITMAKKFHHSCMDTKAMEETGLKGILDGLKKLGGWPVLEEDWDEKNFDWIELGSNSSKLGYPMTSFFHSQVAFDKKNSTRTVIQISGMELLTKWILLRWALSPINFQYYLNYAVDIAVILGADRTKAEEELEESLQLERDLVLMLISTLNSEDSSMTLKELEGNYSYIPWREYFKVNFEPLTAVSEDEKIIVSKPLFFEKLEGILRNTTKKTQANYLMWGIVRDSVHHLTEEIRERDQDFSKLLLGGIEEIPRWKECFVIITQKLSHIISYLYIQKYAIKKYEGAAVPTMIQNIQKEFTKIVQNVDWLDNKTRTNALVKIEAMIYRVAYPDEFVDDKIFEEIYGKLEITPGNFLQSMWNATIPMRDFYLRELRKPVPRSNWIRYMPPFNANALNYRFDNSMNIPPPLLQGDFFNENRPQYMNYARIGFLIGHEILHGFDNLGSQYDEEGNTVDWWNPETKKQFLEKVECIIHQYGNYTVEEVKMNVDGKLTQAENVADNGGIRIAYSAYQEWAKQHGPEPKMSGLEYSPSQLFWISAAQLWCSKIEPKALKYLMQADDHSPFRSRILVSFSNRPEFAEDFNCPSGSKMNPVKKCSVW